jgi:hypothetical protein
MAPALVVAMNAIMFVRKRAFHRCLRVTRTPLQLHGLTAARFDRLFALLRPKGFPWCSQRELRNLLGVSPPFTFSSNGQAAIAPAALIL